MELEFTRKIDELGRVVLPLEMRRAMGLDSGTSVKILCTPDMITLIPLREEPAAPVSPS